MSPSALLEHIGLPEYRHAFLGAGVLDADGLRGLNVTVLRKLGVLDPEHRERILAAVANLRSSAPPAQTDAPEPQGDFDAPTAITPRAALGLVPPKPDKETQVFVYGEGAGPPTDTPAAVDATEMPESEPGPPEEEDEEDDASLDQHDGLVFNQLEADDNTDLPQRDEYLVDPDQPDGALEPSGSALGRFLVVLVALVVLAAAGGWFVIQQALRSDEPASVAPTAQPLPSRPAGRSDVPPPPMPDPVPAGLEVVPDAADAPPLPTRSEPSEPILPSFPCAKAESRVELLICGSAELANLDRRMAKVYGAARRDLPVASADELRAAQKRWLRSRDACVDDACVSKRYRERLAELE